MRGNTSDWLSAQVAVLGSVLLDETCAGKVVARTGPEDYSESYRPIYAAIRAKYAAGETIDPVTLRHALGEGTGDLLMQIMAVTPTAANCDEYIAMMLEQSRLLRLEEIGRQLTEAGGMEEARLLLDQANALSVEREKVRVVTMTDALHDFWDRQSQPKPEYLKWGIPQLDELLYVERGDFVVLGGYASAGKTALALSMAFHQAKTRRVGFYSFETTDRKLFDRLIATITKLDFKRIKGHALSEDNLDVLAMHTSDITSNHLELIPANGMTVSDIKATAQSRRHEVIYIDYLQLITPTNPRESSYEQVTKISMDLHSLAQRTGLTVVALSQLSRPEKSGKGETSGEKAPGMHSLRQSGQIEQDADAILLVYKEDPTMADSRRVLKVAKNKEGQSGVALMLNFDGATQTFRPDRNDPARWKRETPRKDQISIRELASGTPVPFEKEGHT